MILEVGKKDRLLERLLDLTARLTGVHDHVGNDLHDEPPWLRPLSGGNDSAILSRARSF
jgi:hypothetical protein